MNNYFFVDGSSLLADVKRLRQGDDSLAGRKLDIAAFAPHFTGHEFAHFHGAEFRRFTLYFVEGDTRVDQELLIPNITTPGAVNDLRVERCGKSIKEFRRAQTWLEEHDAPQHVRECLYRSEKAMDTQICADALQLAAVGKLDRLFLYTNDYDFVPLCRALRNLGLNTNIFRLQAINPNEELLRECDAFHVMEGWMLHQIFLPLPQSRSAPSDGSA